MKHLLITGAYGLVGSNICKELEKYPDIEVTKSKFDEFPEPVPCSYFDYIIHAAGYGQPQMFGKDKIKTIQVNTVNTERLFSFLKDDGKFLFISTSEVYSGAHSPYFITDIGTTTPQHPRACYIEGKRCGEAICMAYREQGYDVKIARLALAYGEGTKKGDTRVLNQFIEQALTTGEIRLLDKGETRRTYIYIQDAVNLMLDILFKGTQPVYNVGGAGGVQIKTLAEWIAKLTNAKVILGDKGLDGAPDEVKLSMLHTFAEFPTVLTPLEEGLKRTIDYQRKLYVQ